MHDFPFAADLPKHQGPASSTRLGAQMECDDYEAIELLNHQILRLNVLKRRGRSARHPADRVEHDAERALYLQLALKTLRKCSRRGAPPRKC